MSNSDTVLYWSGPWTTILAHAQLGHDVGYSVILALILQLAFQLCALYVKLAALESLGQRFGYVWQRQY